MTEFRPGTSPPPVRMPMRLAGKKILLSFLWTSIAQWGRAMPCPRQATIHYKRRSGSLRGPARIRSRALVMDQFLLEIGPELIREALGRVRPQRVHAAQQRMAGIANT